MSSTPSRQGGGEADPDNADDYADNAAAYAEDLDAIDDAFESIAENAERGVAVMAGHNSFQYLEARYGFAPLAGRRRRLAAKRADAKRDRRHDRTREHGGDRRGVVRPLRVAQARRVDRREQRCHRGGPRHAGRGTTREWNDAGYGYLEQMTEINVPAFERAFDAQ